MGMMGVDFHGAMMEGAHPIQVVAKRRKTVAGRRDESTPGPVATHVAF
jgi:hypothetical protein